MEHAPQIATIPSLRRRLGQRGLDELSKVGQDEPCLAEAIGDQYETFVADSEPFMPMAGLPDADE